MILAKYLVVAGLLASTLTVLSLRSDQDYVPPHQPLDQFPQSMGQWSARDIPLDPEVLKVLGDGFFLNRVYEEPASAATPSRPAGPVGLFIGYFPTQRTGDAIHSPQNCLPGAGWTFLSSHPLELKADNGRTYRVGEYLIGNGEIRQEVLYWYREQGRTVAGEYRAKLDMIIDAMRHNRTDGALIRVITPVDPGEDVADAHNRAVAFTARLIPLLPAYIPN